MSGAQPREARFRLAVQTQRAHEAIARQRRRAEDLRQTSGAQPPLELHLPEPVLGMDEPEREARIEGTVRPDVGIAQRSRTTVTGAPSPATSIAPSTWGKDWRSQR